jgi:hypothetical protein
VKSVDLGAQAFADLVPSAALESWGAVRESPAEEIEAVHRTGHQHRGRNQEETPDDHTGPQASPARANGTRGIAFAKHRRLSLQQALEQAQRSYADFDGLRHEAGGLKINDGKFEFGGRSS